MRLNLIFSLVDISFFFGRVLDTNKFYMLNVCYTTRANKQMIAIMLGNRNDFEKNDDISLKWCYVRE